MASDMHLAALKRKHSALEEEKITLETARPQPDSVQLSELKKQKLVLKEEIEKLSASA